ncbi:Transposase, IS4 [Richelia intracellularis]|nr:Transposase, IS4 [Richelia intracellularis]
MLVVEFWVGNPFLIPTKIFGVTESGDDFTKFSRIYQWFQTLIHPALMQR